MRTSFASRWQSSIVLILMPIVAGGCGFEIPTGGSDGTEVAKSIDGKFQVTMPTGWSVQSELNDAADIQVANPFKEGYLVVLSESKADFEKPTMEWHSETTRTGVLESLTDGQVTVGPKSLDINGKPAVQYEIRGMTDGLKVIYLHTTVDTGDHLHQILAWTLTSYYDDNRPILDSVINSFKSVSP